jgi:PAS domain S-box-containing protein
MVRVMVASVLVVEDDTSAAESIRDALEASSYHVSATVPSGARALEAAAHSPPSLVLMDVQLDGPLDGIETATLLRERMDVPVVYLTNSVDLETLRRAKQTAPHGYLRKPFGPRELMIAVELALHQHGLEQVAAAREQWFANTLYSIADAVLTVDAEERVTFANGAAERLLGRSRAAMDGAPLGEVAPLVDARGASLQGLLAAALRVGKVTPLPADARLAEGPGAFVEGTIAPMVSMGKDRPGRSGAAIVLRDVGERRRLERRLLATERLAAIGTMAAGMRHEINNPLAFVAANVNHALERLRDGGHAEIVSALEDAAYGAERVRSIVDGLRPIAQGDEGRRQRYPLEDLVDDAVRASAHALRHHARLEISLGSTPSLLVDRERMAAAIVTLLLGAASRVGEGRADASVIRLRTYTGDEGRAVLEVEDDGRTLDDLERTRMFNPFAASGNATAGVELAVAQRTILAHGGEIEVRGADGSGTLVRLVLPPCREQEHAAAEAARPVTARRTERPTGSQNAPKPVILIVDDEPAIGRSIGRILAPGHDVVFESDARMALGRVLRGERFDAILCDLMMPAMSGMDFFDELCVQAPLMRDRVVFLTGGAFTPRSEQFLRELANPCLPKPFSRTAVVDAIQQVLVSH